MASMDSEFAYRSLEHRYGLVLAEWRSCPDCGSPVLQQPRLADAIRCPDLGAVCTGCGTAFGIAVDGMPRPLTTT